MDEEWGDFGDTVAGSSQAAFDSDPAWAASVTESEPGHGVTDASTRLINATQATTVDALRIQLEDLFPDTCNSPERSTYEGEAAVEAQDEDPSSVEVDDFAGPMQVPDGEAVGEFVWIKSMCQLLLYAQIGVAVPRYEIEKKREELISDANHRFASPLRPRHPHLSDARHDNDEGGADHCGNQPTNGAGTDGDSDDDEGPTLTFHRRPSSSNVVGKATTTFLDGLYAAGSATTNAVAMVTQTTQSAVARTADAVKDVGRGVSSVVVMPVRVVAQAVVRGRGSCTVASADDNVSAMFRETLAGLTPEQIEQLGIVSKENATDVNVENASVIKVRSDRGDDEYILVSDEARLLAQKMWAMEQALKHEDDEMMRQARILEIERLEAEMYPEVLVSDKGDAILGGDRFSKEMEARGLRHVSNGGSERHIRHTDLPDELDLFVWKPGSPRSRVNSHSVSSSGPHSPRSLSMCPVFADDTVDVDVLPSTVTVTATATATSPETVRDATVVHQVEPPPPVTSSAEVVSPCMDVPTTTAATPAVESQAHVSVA
eukprot:m.191532 g.191532  ORF g.191532 m.191532 type:complete len:545 (+) comp18374_c0_seq1:195-1829(+)